MAQTEIKAVITAEDRASATLGKFGSKIGKVGKIAAIGLAAAGAAAVAFGISSVKSFNESELATAQLNAVLKSTKGIAGVTSKAALDLAQSMQSVSRYSDEEVLSAENMLLTFTKIGKNIFPETTKAVLDMSTAMGTDLKSTSIQVGKALQDPVKGVTALQRVGVRLSDSQKELVQRLVATGHTAEAQKVILKELKTEFGGSAEAAGNTFAGKLDKLKNAFDNIKETIGKFIVVAITPLVDWLSRLVSNTDKANGATSKLKSAFDVIVGVVKTLIYYYNIYATAFINTFKKYWESSIKPALMQFWTVLKTQLMPALKDLWEQVGPLLGPALKYLGILVGTVVVAAIILFARWASFVTSLTAKFYKAVSILIGFLRAIIGPFNKVSFAIYNYMIEPIKTVITWLSKLARKFLLVDVIKGALSKIYGVITGAFGPALNWVIDKISTVISLMNQLSPAKIGSVAKAVAGAASKASRKASGTDFFSPRKYAGGTSGAYGGMALVGERGPEMVTLPRGSKVSRADETRRMMGGVSNINISINAGAYLGSQQEARKHAKVIYQALVEMAGMKGQTLQQLIAGGR